jgi:acyl-lipid omega-6 desaturase (Delta-12 desaturase)
LNDRPKSAGGMANVRALTRSLAGYRKPNFGRSVVEILITVVPFILLWLLMWLSLRIGYGFYLLLAVPAAGFLVRLFMIQHDCGHARLILSPSIGKRLGRPPYRRVDTDTL